MRPLYIQRLDDDQPLPHNSFLDHIDDIAIECCGELQGIKGINIRVIELLGWTDTDIASSQTSWFQLFTETTREDLLRAIAGYMSDPSMTIEPVTVEARTSSGPVVSLRVHSIFVKTDSILLLARASITENELEEILRQTQARFRSIVDGLSVNLILKDAEGRRVYANRPYLELRKLQLADLIGKTDEELFPIEIAERFIQDDHEVLETGKLIHKFEENIRLDGTRTWTEVIKGPIRDADNHISGIQILFWDATERKATEQALERERYLLHMLLDNVPDSIYFKDKQSRFVRISRGMASKLGLASPDEAIGKTDADIFTSEHSQKARETEVQIMATGEPIVSQVERETWPNRPDTWASTTKLPLRDANGEIVGTFGVSRDITELIKTEMLLREARDTADNANRAKGDFLANMSHEIRTPMNGILGMAELLRHTQLSDAQRSFLDMIEQSAQSLLRIINDILDFSKIEAGKLDLDPQPFDLRQCVSHAAKSLAARAATKGTELILNLAPDLPEQVIGDSIRLRQVLVNLVGNAIKFTQQGEITIEVAIADGPPAAPNYTLLFSVADTGIGIPAEKQKTIFEAFSQADVSTTRQYGGTGLGLSISSQLVEMMQGRIWLESEVGVGSTFHFTASFAPCSQESISKYAKEERRESLKNIRVLLIDDNLQSRNALHSALSRRGMVVHTVGTSEEGHQYLQTEIAGGADFAHGHFVLIVDHNLSNADGLQVVSELRSQYNLSTCIAILLSNIAVPISEQDLIDHNIQAVLQKPALPSEITFAVRQALGQVETTTAPVANAQSQPTGPALRILLAEDGEVNRIVLVGLLESRGHEVICTSDGQEAIDKWQELECGKDIDAIFMDVQMPILDGLEATRHIRAMEADRQLSAIPIIAITAAAMESDYKRCLQAGMDSYLSKPVDFTALDQLLAKLQSGSLSRTDAVASQPLTASIRPDLARPHQWTLNFDSPLSKLKCTKTQQRKLVTTLEQETNQRLEELTQALSLHDGKLLIRASHSLKSAAALFEAKKVAQAAAIVEQFARNGDATNAEKHFAELRRVTRDMLDEIANWLAQNRETETQAT